MEQNKFDWDLTKFCKDIKDCENKLKQIDIKLEELVKYKGKLNNPSTLLEFWEKEQETESIFEDCYIYALASKDIEETDQSFQQLSQKVMNMGSKISSKLAFVYPEFKHLGNDYLRSLLKDKNFENWKLEIEKIIDENEHTLSEAEEQILAQVGSFSVGFKNVYSSCFFGDVKYQDATDENGVAHKITSGVINKYLFSNDRELRKNVSLSVKEAYLSYQNSMAINFIYQLKQNVVISKIRKYKSVLDKSVSTYKTSPQVYNNIINYTKQNINFVTRYFGLKKKILNFNPMFTYDMNIDIIKNNKKYSYEEGISLIKNAMSILGEDYVALIDKAVNEHWIDVYPKEHKQSGAYTWGRYGKTYIILTNWNDDLESVYTLAHELGHAIQHYITEQNQEKQNSNFPIYIAEVASLFNEIILSDYLLKHSQSEDEKINVLSKQINDINSVIFNKVKHSEFEDFCYKALENDESLSKEILNDKWLQINKQGLENIIDYSTFNTLRWENIFHYYNVSYYVWQYALAFMIATNFATNIIENKKNAKENYLQFLKGTNKYFPTQFLQSLGIDIDDDKFYQQFFETINNKITEFENLFNN